MSQQTTTPPVMPHAATAPATPKARPTVSRYGGLRVQTGVKAGLGFASIFFGGYGYPHA